jgi:hypothetical protein
MDLCDINLNCHKFVDHEFSGATTCGSWFDGVPPFVVLQYMELMSHRFVAYENQFVVHDPGIRPS